MQFVDEQNNAFVLHDLLHDALETRLKLTAVFGPGDERTQIKRHDPLVEQGIGDFTLNNQLRQTFNDRRLAYAWLTDQYRIVLGATA